MYSVRIFTKLIKLFTFLNDMEMKQREDLNVSFAVKHKARESVFNFQKLQRIPLRRETPKSIHFHFSPRKMFELDVSRKLVFLASENIQTRLHPFIRSIMEYLTDLVCSSEAKVPT